MRNMNLYIFLKKLKHIKVLRVFIAYVACCAFLSVSYSCRGNEITHVKVGGFKYPPFYVGEGAAATGVAADLSAEIFKRLSISRDVAVYPMKRLLHNMEVGETDVALFLLKTAERSRYLAYSTPLLKIPGRLWSRVDREGGPIQFDTLGDLRQYRFGVTLGYSYGVELDAWLKQMRANTALDDYTNYRLLLNKRIEVFPGNEVVAKYIFKQHPELQGKFAPAQRLFANWDYHLVVSKKSPALKLLPKIDKIIADLKKEGVVDEIVRKYTE